MEPQVAIEGGILIVGLKIAYDVHNMAKTVTGGTTVKGSPSAVPTPPEDPDPNGKKKPK